VANRSDLLTEIRERGTFKKSDLRQRVVDAIKAFKATWNG
jgi:hypothetical protein